MSKIADSNFIEEIIRVYDPLVLKLIQISVNEPVGSNLQTQAVNSLANIVHENNRKSQKTTQINADILPILVKFLNSVSIEVQENVLMTFVNIAEQNPMFEFILIEHDFPQHLLRF